MASSSQQPPLKRHKSDSSSTSTIKALRNRPVQGPSRVLSDASSTPTITALRNRPSNSTVIFATPSRREPYLEALYDFAIEQQYEGGALEMAEVGCKECARRNREEESLAFAQEVEERQRRRKIWQDQQALRVEKREKKKKKKKKKRRDSGKEAKGKGKEREMPPPVMVQGGVRCSYGSSDGGTTLVGTRTASVADAGVEKNAKPAVAVEIEVKKEKSCLKRMLSLMKRKTVRKWNEMEEKRKWKAATRQMRQQEGIWWNL